MLVVDDQFNEDIKNLIESLVQKGFHVQYWDSKGEFHESISNIRVLILDLDLTNGKSVRGDKFYFYNAAKVLEQIKGPYIVIIYSRDFVEKDIQSIKDAYEEVTQTPFAGYIEGIDGIQKGTAIDELIKLLLKIIDDKEVYRLIVSWEKLIDKSKDLGLKKFVREKFENEIKAYVKSIGKDFDEESLPREFVSNMMRFVIRYMQRGSEFENLQNLLKEINDEDNAIEISDLLLQNRNMYFTPDEKEKIWTGDIFKKEETENFWSYHIVITPECDIAWNKAENFLVCKGFAIDFNSLKEKNHPIYSIKKDFKMPKRENFENDKDYEKNITDQLNSLHSGYARYHPVWNFSETEGKYLGLCFDFQNVMSLNSTEFKKDFSDKRISRLDIPYITYFMQQFANYSTRLGLPPINQPHMSND